MRNLKKAVKNKSSLAAIRNLAEYKEGFRAALSTSINQVIEKINNRFSRMKLKRENIITYKGVKKEEIEDRLDVVRQFVQADLTKLNSSMNSKELHKLKDLKDFIERHGKSSHYGFQLKKCGNCPYCVLNPIKLDDAEFNKLHFLPDPIPDETGQHYKPFDQLYGMMTNDKHRPSFANVQGLEDEADRINRDVLKSGKSRDVILCSECFKPRCVYSNTKMSREQDGILLRIKEDDNYTCGDAFPEDSGLFVRESLSCNSEVEINYFGAAMRHFVPPCCIYCGKTEDLLDDQDDYIQNLPVKPLELQEKKLKHGEKVFCEKIIDNSSTFLL